MCYNTFQTDPNRFLKELFSSFSFLFFFSLFILFLGHDALRNLCDSNTQKVLLLDRPLLKVKKNCILFIIIIFKV